MNQVTLQYISAWFKPIRYPENDELDRKSVLLNVMIFMNSLLGLGLAFTHLAFFHYATSRFWDGILVSFFVLVLLIPLRKGYVDLACKLFVLGMLFFITHAVATSGTIRAPLAFTFVVVVVCAGLLQNLRFVIITIGLCSVSILGLILAEQHHLLPPPVPNISVDQWLITTEIIIWIGWITHYTVRNLINARANARYELIEKEKAVIALRQNEELLSRVFRCSPAAMAVTSMKDNRVRRVNDTFVQLLGYKLEELVGQRTDRLGIWESRAIFLQIVKDIREKGEINNSEIQIRKNDGSLISGLLSAAPVDLIDEQLFVWGFFDLTDRENAEKMRLDFERKMFEVQKEELRADYDRMELVRAHDLQTSLLPSISYHYSPFLINSRSISATEVGGDYFDYFGLPSGNLIVVIGDVSGHGMSSGLLMAMVKASLYSIVSDSSDINTVLATLNKIVRLGGSTQKMFLTFCYMILNPHEGLLSCSINGHPFPLVRHKDGTIIELSESAYPLGVRSQLDVKVVSNKLKPGDKVLLFTDGIPEITNPEGLVWGYHSVFNLLQEKGELGGEDFINKLFEEVMNHASGKQHEDDMTALVIEMQESS